MRKTNYSYEKRSKEIAKQKKREAKRRRKEERRNKGAEGNAEQPPSEQETSRS